MLLNQLLLTAAICVRRVAHAVVLELVVVFSLARAGGQRREGALGVRGRRGGGFDGRKAEFVAPVEEEGEEGEEDDGGDGADGYAGFCPRGEAGGGV